MICSYYLIIKNCKMGLTDRLAHASCLVCVFYSPCSGGKITLANLLQHDADDATNTLILNTIMRKYTPSICSLCLESALYGTHHNIQFRFDMTNVTST